MQEVVQAINELTNAIISHQFLNDFLLNLVGLIISISALFISLLVSYKQSKIALLPVKEQTYKELNNLIFYYITYRISENPFEKNRFSYGSVVQDEEDILRRSNLHFSKEKNNLINKIKDTSLKIRLLNLEAEVYFDKLLEEKGRKVYEDLKRYVVETTALSEFDFEREAKFSELCHDNILYLNEGTPNCNYYELRKKIRVYNNELGVLYLEWNQTKQDVIKI